MDNLTLEEVENLPREYLTAKEVSAIMGMSPYTFYKQHSKMPFPVNRLGKNYRIPKKPFVEYMRTGRRSN